MVIIQICQTNVSHCGMISLNKKGVGTQQIEEQIKKFSQILMLQEWTGTVQGKMGF